MSTILPVQNIAVQPVQTEEEFKQYLLTTFEVAAVSELPFDHLDYAYQIFYSNQDVSFSDEDLRLSNFMPLMAALYAFKNRVKVLFISPTHYYGLQASKFCRSYLKHMGASSESEVLVTVPGLCTKDHLREIANKSPLIFMHGMDFNYENHIPMDLIKRKIVQIFPNEKVPVDPIRHSVCHDPCD